MNLHTVQRFCAVPEAAHCIKDNIDAVDEALRLVRDLSVDLRPPLLDDLGLATALCWYVDRYSKRAGVATEIQIDLPNHNERFSRELETACFRIAQEALTNVVRHARATLVSLRLTRKETVLEMIGERRRSRIRSGSFAETRAAGGDARVVGNAGTRARRRRSNRDPLRARKRNYHPLHRAA